MKSIRQQIRDQSISTRMNNSIQRDSQSIKLLNLIKFAGSKRLLLIWLELPTKPWKCPSFHAGVLPLLNWRQSNVYLVVGPLSVHTCFSTSARTDQTRRISIQCTNSVAPMMTPLSVYISHSRMFITIFLGAVRMHVGSFSRWQFCLDGCIQFLIVGKF